jgi:hypothetical protein
LSLCFQTGFKNLIRQEGKKYRYLDVLSLTRFAICLPENAGQLRRGSSRLGKEASQGANSILNRKIKHCPWRFAGQVTSEDFTNLYAV